MPNILRISEAASLAMHTMVYLACHKDTLVSTREVAKVLKASEAHLSKVLQRLARVGLVKSIRGPKGGFTLGRPPAKITLLEIFETIEGPLNSEVCLFGSNKCLGKDCLFGGLLHDLYNQTHKYFSKTTLNKLTHIFE